jgi:hypothetical protein
MFLKRFFNVSLKSKECANMETSEEQQMYEEAHEYFLISEIVSLINERGYTYVMSYIHNILSERLDNKGLLK